MSQVVDNTECVTHLQYLTITLVEDNDNYAHFIDYQPSHKRII